MNNKTLLTPGNSQDIWSFCVRNLSGHWQRPNKFSPFFLNACMKFIDIFGDVTTRFVLCFAMLTMSFPLSFYFIFPVDRSLTKCLIYSNSTFLRQTWFLVVICIYISLYPKTYIWLAHSVAKIESWISVLTMWSLYCIPGISLYSLKVILCCYSHCLRVSTAPTIYLLILPEFQVYKIFLFFSN